MAALGDRFGLGKRLKKALGTSRAQESYENQRASKRVALPIPVRLQVGARGTEQRRLHDVSLLGLFIESSEAYAAGERAGVRFDGYPGICETFVLYGSVVRQQEGKNPGVGILIDRKETSDEALKQYRQLVLHYLRHRPLLEDRNRGLFEGRCKACGWLGRVARRSPRCSKCGGLVVPV